MIGYVYLTTCTATGQRYVGAHRSAAVDDDYLGSGPRLRAAVAEHGPGAFTKRVLATADDEAELARLELWWITVLDAVNDPTFLNQVDHSLAADDRLANLRPYAEAGVRRVVPVHTPDVTNGNFGHRWTAAQRRALSELRRANGRSRGVLNGMHGRRGERAVNGQRLCMRTPAGRLERVFATKQLAMEFLGIRGHVQLNRAIANRLVFRGHLWTQNDEHLVDAPPAASLNDFA